MFLISWEKNTLIPYKDYTSNLVKIFNNVLHYNISLSNTRLRLFKEYITINKATTIQGIYN